MPSIIHLNTIWEHTLTEILNHDNKTEVGIIMRSWVKHNKLEDMSDLLIYDLNDFTPAGTLWYSLPLQRNSRSRRDQNHAKYTSEGALQPLQVHPSSHSQIGI